MIKRELAGLTFFHQDQLKKMGGGGGARTLIKCSFAGVIPEVASALPIKCTGIGNQ